MKAKMIFNLEKAGLGRGTTESPWINLPDITNTGDFIDMFFSKRNVDFEGRKLLVPLDNAYFSWDETQEFFTFMGNIYPSDFFHCLYTEAHMDAVRTDDVVEIPTKPIDKVTTDRLDLALRMVGITFDHKTIDKIIDLVELIEEKGGETSIQDIENLKAEWKWSFDESGN